MRGDASTFSAGTTLSSPRLMVSFAKPGSPNSSASSADRVVLPNRADQ